MFIFQQSAFIIHHTKLQNQQHFFLYSAMLTIYKVPSDLSIGSGFGLEHRKRLDYNTYETVWSASLLLRPNTVKISKRLLV
jgi:hypothetical protein